MIRATAFGGTDEQLLNCKRAIRFGVWNVRTLNAAGRKELLVDELIEHDVPLAVLTECRLTRSGETLISGTSGSDQYVLYHSGGTTHNYGVGFAVSSRYAANVVEFKPFSDRLALLHISTSTRPVFIVAAYAPTNVAMQVEKDHFYHQLQTVVSDIPRNGIMLVAGDLNAETGSDRMGWSEVLGPHGHGTRNDNGLRMLTFCSHNDLLVGNSWFRHKGHHAPTFYSNDGNTKKRLDYLLVDKRSRSSVEDIKVNHDANILSDHKLVIGKIRIHLKMKRFAKFAPRLDLTALKYPDNAIRFNHEVRTQMQATSTQADLNAKWNSWKNAISVATEKVCPKLVRPTKRWISPGTLDLIAERKALGRGPRRNFLVREVRRALRADEDRWWQEKAQLMQEAADRGDSKTLFRTIGDLSGKRQVRPPHALLDDSGHPVTSPDSQKKLWKSYFQALLNRPDPTSLDPQLDGLHPDVHVAVDESPPTLMEVKQAIRNLKANKSPGACGIQSEHLKALDDDGVQALHSLIEGFWVSRSVPQDFKDGIIIPLHKKGSRSTCSNYRGITLLSIAGKVLTTIIRARLSALYEQTMREQQAGFRSGRGCADQIFTLRQCFERRFRYGQPTLLSFIDFAAAFDSVHRESMWKVLRHCGIPQSIVDIIRSIYTDSSTRIRTSAGFSEPFQISTGVRQGCVLSPMLFNLVLNWVLERVVQPLDGVSYAIQETLADLEYADDIVTFSESAADAENLLNRIADFGAKFGLKIKPEKSKVVHTLAAEPAIAVEGNNIECVETFTYLGSIMSSNSVACSADVDARITKAASTFGRLSHCLFRRRDINIRTKMRVYNAAVISTLLYGSESWVLRKAEVDKLEVFQMGCLRSIAGISRIQRYRNDMIREMACQQPTVAELVRKHRLRWLGHVLRMDDSRLPRKMWHEPQIPTWKCTRNAPKLTWYKMVINDLEKTKDPASGMSPRDTYGSVNWTNHQKAIITDIAKDRTQWKRLTSVGQASAVQLPPDDGRASVP